MYYLLNPMKHDIFLRNMSQVYLYLTGRILHQYYVYRLDNVV